VAVSADPLGISPLVAPCVIHATHQPRAWINDEHHVVLESWTKALGLPQWRKLPICPTGHVNIHAAIRDRIAGRPYEFYVNPAMKELVDEAMEFWEANKTALTSHAISGLEIV